jgi:hypothetical protein
MGPPPPPPEAGADGSKPDDQEVQELADFLNGVHDRFASVTSLREVIGTEFSLEHYEAALRLDPALRTRLLDAQV